VGALAGNGNERGASTIVDRRTSTFSRSFGHVKAHLGGDATAYVFGWG
jgi:hypothetical protein